ncbi:MAG: GGDEF domain-containing protein [Byssovorax sp.]
MSRHSAQRVSFPTLLDLDAAATGALPRVSPKPMDRGVLVQMCGAETGRIHRAIGTITLGRGEGCSVRFDDGTLSRVHARLIEREDEHVLEDAGSLNGTYVNDRRITSSVLFDGDRLRLGSGASLRFHLIDEEEERALVHTYDSSIRDGLTGLFNRRHLEERLASETAFALRHGTDLSVVMIDLDHFKRINDAGGHLAGDAVLRHVATLISTLVRMEDIVARYGGEELCVVTRGVGVEGTALLGERIRASIEAARILFEGTILRVTASAGAGTLSECSDRTAAGILARADSLLYQAKALGRNRVVYR